MEKQTLPEYMYKKGAIGVEECVRIGLDISRALESLHAQGIVYGGIVPKNIIRNDDGSFLLGPLVKPGEDLNGDLVSASYTAPEVMLGGARSTSSDVYALGMLLYQLLNDGRMPFLPPAPAVVTQEHLGLAAQRRAIAQEDPNLPMGADARLGSIVCRAVAPDPNRRYASAREFGDALREWKGDKGFSQAPSPSAGPAATASRVGASAGFAGATQGGAAGKSAAGASDAGSSRKGSAGAGKPSDPGRGDGQAAGGGGSTAPGKKSAANGDGPSSATAETEDVVEPPLRMRFFRLLVALKSFNKKSGGGYDVASGRRAVGTIMQILGYVPLVLCLIFFIEFVIESFGVPVSEFFLSQPLPLSLLAPGLYGDLGFLWFFLLIVLAGVLLVAAESIDPNRSDLKPKDDKSKGRSGSSSPGPVLSQSGHIAGTGSVRSYANKAAGIVIRPRSDAREVVFLDSADWPNAEGARQVGCQAVYEWMSPHGYALMAICVDESYTGNQSASNWLRGLVKFESACGEAGDLTGGNLIGGKTFESVTRTWPASRLCLREYACRFGREMLVLRIVAHQASIEAATQAFLSCIRRA